MEKRKAIAVVTADIFSEYMNSIVKGISAECEALGYDALIMVTSFNLDDDSPLRRGEENIFSLINNKNVDGVLLLVGNARNQMLLRNMADMVSEMGIPAVSVDYNTDFCESIFTDASDFFEQMTDHFIDDHGCRDIICLTGFEGITPSVTRLNGYKHSLAKHGMEIKEDNIIYGDFWKDAAKKLADSIISGSRRCPDAIVCANDVMGVTLCNALIKGGIDVPGRVRISGYDGSRVATENIPSLSTIYPENDLLGARAVCRLHELISGEKIEPSVQGKGSLILSASCGCSQGAEHIVKRREKYVNCIQMYEYYYHRSGMQESLMESKTLDEFFQKLMDFTYLLNGVETFMFCLGKDWDSVEEADDSDYIREGYSANMKARFVAREQRGCVMNESFSSEDMIPQAMRDVSPRPSTFFLLPVHYLDRCYGYSIFKFSDMEMAVSMVFALWNRAIGTALEFLRVRTKLTSINQRILMSSIRDVLTGIYNRKGFNRLSESIFKRAQADGNKLLLIIADLDGLKNINDNYGHTEGDRAITIAANALNTCCENNEVCARIGGDEYAIIGSGNYTDSMVEGYIKYIKNFLDRYNKFEAKPYSVGASLGWFCGVPEQGKELQDYFEIADKRMYQNKIARKKLRPEA